MTDGENKEAVGKMPDGGRRRRSVPARVFLLLAKVAGALVILVTAALLFLDFYLTPDRLGRIVSRYAGDYVEADVDASSIDFSVWSTFPFFYIDVHDATIVSRRLKKLPADVRAKLPAACDTLARFTRFSVSINPWYLLVNKVVLKSIKLDGLQLNMIAVNDSVNNYMIVSPTDNAPLRLPPFTIKEVQLSNPRDIVYFSLPTKALATLSLNGASLTRHRHDKNSYKLMFGGKLDLDVDHSAILSGFPFSFNGDVGLKFNPFRINITDYSINLANVRSSMDMSISMADRNGGVTRLDYRISPFSLLKLFEYLPASWIANLKDIKSNVQLEAQVHLKSPFRFESGTLPDFSIDFVVPDSYLSYTFAGTGTYTAHDLGLRATLDFNGNDPDKSVLRIGEFHLAGEGVQVMVNGIVDNLFTTPGINANIDAHADFSKIASTLKGLRGMTVRGQLACAVNVAFRLDEMARHEFSRISAKGDLLIKGLEFRGKRGDFSIKSSNVSFHFGDRGMNLGGRSMLDGMLAFTSAADTVHIDIPGYSIDTRRLAVSGGTEVKSLAIFAKENVVPPFRIDVAADKASAMSLADSARLHTAHLKIGGELTGLHAHTEHPHLECYLNADRMDYADRFTKGTLAQLETDLDLDMNGYPKADRRYLRNLFSQFGINGKVKASGGTVTNYVYPAMNRLSDINLSFTPDAVSLKRLTVQSQSNRMTVKGKISNLRHALSKCHGRPVRIDLDVQADTLNINQMARTYTNGKKMRQRLVARGLLPTPVKDTVPDLPGGIPPADTVPLIIPKDILADIKLGIKESRYTNLHIFDIGARVLLKEGDLRIDSLYAHTDFGHAYMNLLYSTRNPLDMNMSFDVALQQINVVTFFERFHALLEMMPYMSNLSGFVSANATGSFDIYPDMDMNLASARAMAYVEGDCLKVHRSPLIHRIARMLLIHNNNDIHIKQMKVRASVHDNLLEVYPFLFEFDRYKLGLLGENDFNGNLYYHISVLKSPVPFKFGINIEGDSDDVKLRFGGYRFKENEVMRHTNIVDLKKVNFVKNVKWFLGKFIEKASQSADNPSEP